MRGLLLPPLQEDPKILEDVTYTWLLRSWSSISQKELSPVFQAGGYPWYVWAGLDLPLCPSLTVLLKGALSFFQRETIMPNTARSTFSMALKLIQFLKIGAAAFNLLFSCGIQMIPVYILIVRHITALRKTRVTGVSPELLNSARCSVFLGMDPRDHYARTTCSMYLHMFELLKTRQARFGTTFSITIPRKRLATWD
jgi:heme exporter protein D